eukprot:786156-Rhodomonas_salina.1
MSCLSTPFSSSHRAHAHSIPKSSSLVCRCARVSSTGTYEMETSSPAEISAMARTIATRAVASTTALGRQA